MNQLNCGNMYGTNNIRGLPGPTLCCGMLEKSADTHLRSSGDPGSKIFYKSHDTKHA